MQPSSIAAETLPHAAQLGFKQVGQPNSERRHITHHVARIGHAQRGIGHDPGLHPMRRRGGRVSVQAEEERAGGASFSNSP